MGLYCSDPDYLLIVLLFQTSHYKADVYVYYALTFLIPVVVGMFEVYKGDRIESA